MVSLVPEPGGRCINVTHRIRSKLKSVRPANNIKRATTHNHRQLVNVPMTAAAFFYGTLMSPVVRNRGTIALVGSYLLCIWALIHLHTQVLCGADASVDHHELKNSKIKPQHAVLKVTWKKNRWTAWWHLYFVFRGTDDMRWRAEITLQLYTRVTTRMRSLVY